jgi:bilirubin oxidase
MLTRREFLKTGAMASAAILFNKENLRLQKPSRRQRRRREPSVPVPGGTLDPTTITKYAEPLVIPPAMPRTDEITGPQGDQIDYYEISVRQFTQQILPTGMPATTVWGYGSMTTPGTYNYPSFTIEGTTHKPVRVKWVNELMDGSGNYLPHLLAVDPTLHWANPPGPRDMRPMFETTPGPYTGPVPMVVHVHGARSYEESDGYAEAWYLPAANNIPGSYFPVGSFYEVFKKEAEEKYAVTWEPGSVVFEYPNDQRASTNWYHDHTLGMTRLNVYAGPAGFYLLRGGEFNLEDGSLPGPAPSRGDAPGTKYFEFPIAIQDRSFNSNGSLFYPDSRKFFDGFEGPYIPDSDISPIWNPEFFGNVMVVNGRSWPSIEVEPRRYRFRLLNGCNARFLILRLASDPTARPATSVLPFWQIGCEGGFLDAPTQLETLLMSPAERADVVVDFTGLTAGTEIFMVNEGPDEPYGGGQPGVDFPFADPGTTGQVMKFVVGTLSGPDNSTPPDLLTLPTRIPIGPHVRTRRVSLNEEDSSVLPGVGPREAELGTVGFNLLGEPFGIVKSWMSPITEDPLVGDIEVWEIYNFTMDAHPIHIHEILFEVVNRQAIGNTSTTPPQSWELGLKDSVIAYPGAITRIKAHFNRAGLFVWHCHIVEHEDNEMMRPYRIRHKTLIPLVSTQNNQGK